MIDIGVAKGSAKWKRLMTLLHSSHIIRVTVRVTTLQGTYGQDLSGLLLGGQVTVDATAEVTRGLTIQLFDPFQRLQLDPDDPGKLSVGMADLVSVVYTVINPDTIEVFDIPLFRGPIEAVSRDRTTLSLTCVGKEALGMPPTYVGKIYKKNAKKTDVIKDILRVIMGETEYQVPDLSAKLPANLKLEQGNSPWPAAKKLAASMGYQLFYDGRGVARMRKPPGKVQHSFTGEWVTTSPSITYDTTQVINIVTVKGGTPKKAKKAVQYTMAAPPSHPLSPPRLGRNGVPRYLFSSIENSALMSTGECKAVASETLKRGLLLGNNAQWSGLPMPLLEEQDLVSVVVPGFAGSVALKQFTVPLTIGEASYGYAKLSRPSGRGGQVGVNRRQYSAYQRQAARWRKALNRKPKKPKKDRRKK